MVLLVRQITGEQAESCGTNVGPQGRKRNFPCALFVAETTAVTYAHAAGIPKDLQSIDYVFLEWRRELDDNSSVVEKSERVYDTSVRIGSPRKQMNALKSSDPGNNTSNGHWLFYKFVPL